MMGKVKMIAYLGNLRTYDNSFSSETLLLMLRKSDFFDNRSLHDENFKNSIIDMAVKSAHSLFNGTFPLIKFPLHGKTIYSIDSLPNKLVLRKIYHNINYNVSINPTGRDLVVHNLHRLVGEGVPYRLYRLDIKKFYESFSTKAVIDCLIGLPGLSPPSKTLIHELLSRYISSGGTGIPRGLALSALIAEVMMQDFDFSIHSKAGVYFYSRYVDDIVILTNGNENPKLFENEIVGHLPEGLTLHERKTQTRTITDIVIPAKHGTPPLPKIQFDFLGYSVNVYEPEKKSGKKSHQHFRKVIIDISHSKVRKIKTRIIKSILAFSSTGNFDLLLNRIKFLTSNFSIQDFHRDSSKLAGIYYSYPEIADPENSKLQELDKFLKMAILSKNGRVFSKFSTLLKPKERRKLLKQSFLRGYKEKTMVYFHPTKIKEIQKCWKYE